MPVFLFTDLESSTRLWEHHPDAMREALARHDRILRAAIDAGSGLVVKTTGDGVMAVFPSPDGAAAAALDAQIALAGEGWESTGPLRVRMGIHAGEAEERDGDFFGPAVNRTARIMASGHGGQVLLSAAAAGGVDGHLPEGSDLRDLGVHRLKDLTGPEHLFQLTHVALSADFPPLATLDLRPNNLPVQVSEFFGRESELETIRVMLEDPATRLVTLTGPGGTGKTRLGIQVGAELLDRYRDGAFFIDLSSEREPDSAFEAMLRALDLADDGEGAPLQVLKERLRDRSMLLILDNFEQVTAAAVGVAELLQTCPGIEVVVTSREALRLRDEHVLPIPPLALPDPHAPLATIAASEAVRLFIERARSVRPDFALTDENAAAVAEISIRLDGLPLALELAAARLKLFTAGDLLDRLRQRSDVLGGGARDLPARQRTLRAAIEWSYELLDHDECRVFELMSVFSTARLEAVEAVAAEVHGDIDVLDVLASLVDKSLVRGSEAAGSQRFSMLATIREYATERLAGSPEADAVLRAHARFFSEYSSGLCGSLQGPGRELALEGLSSEIGNLRTSWRYWVDAADLEQLYLLLDGLWALHYARGWYHAAVELTTDLLDVLATAEPSLDRDQEEVTLRTSLARALMAVRGYTPEVEQEFQRALALSGSGGSAANRFPVLRALSFYYMNLAEFARSQELGREMIELAEQENDRAMQVEAHFVFGSATAFTGDLTTGLLHLDQAIALFDPQMHGSGRFQLGTSPGVVSRTAAALLRWQAGFMDQAAARASEAIELARSLAHPFSLAYALYHVAFFEVGRRRFETARELALELMTVATENDYPVWRALASVIEGVALCGMGRAEEGLAMTEAGLDLYQGLTTPPVFWPPLLSLRAAAFAMAGHPDRAVELIDEAITLGGEEETSAPDFRMMRGDFLMMLPKPDHDGADACYRAALVGSHAIGMRLVELQAATRLVDLQQARGQTPDESDGLRRIYETFTEGFDEPDLAAARLTLGVG